MQFLYPELFSIVVMLTITIIGVTYMLGKFFRNPAWEAYLSIELNNLFFALLILIAAFGFFEVSHQLSIAFLHGDPVEISKNFLRSTIDQGVLPMYKDLLAIETEANLSNAFYFRFGPGAWSWTLKVCPGADLMSSLARLMGAGLLAIYSTLNIQFIGFNFIDWLMPSLLSLGLLLFVFPPTRESGAFVISFAFAFQIIYPCTYALCEKASNDIWGGKIYEPTFWLFGHDTSIIKMFLPFAMSQTLAPIAFIVIVPFVKAMAHLALFSLVFPALSMTITIAFINSTTKFLMRRI